MKRFKLVIYGEPGVGKSVFACKAPKPFFITTDGNYEWLEEFGADPTAHQQVNSWEEAKQVFSKSFDGYETIVVDLLEDLFKWCEYEYCTRNKVEHVADIGYGKGYDCTRNEFFIEICKLIGKDKNIIFIMHGTSWVVKDRRGVEHTRFGPSSKLPEKVLDSIEGRVRYFLRCYLKDEEHEDGTLTKRRYLSIVPKPNEFGIIRGIDETKIPHDIPLDFNEFMNVIGYSVDEKPNEEVKQTKKRVKHAAEPDTSAQVNKEPVKKSEEDVELAPVDEAKPDDKDVKTKTEADVKPEPKSEETKQPAKSEETEQEVKPTETAVKPAATQSNSDKLAAIRAKLAALNVNK